MLVEQSFPMTREGFEQLKEELEILTSVEHSRAKRRIVRARRFCDFQEDSEYEAALKELAKIEDRITSIQYMLRNAVISEEKNHTVVEIGSTVVFKELPKGAIETYRIVGREEANPVDGKISYASPIAQQLIGAGVGEEKTIQTPGGERIIRILSVS